MNNVVIKVENLSKQYRLGSVGTGTLSHDLNRFWAKIQGRDDPYIKIGSNNDRTRKGDSDYVWALNNVNFEVRRGEVLGIIGRNGAGKSTLLKILSQITRPSQGSVRMKGRVGSLLEVGTGFHPELTGKENIFINGAILGMRKWEIEKKIDEIIDFAGVERYIDTPVKRYSSGMMVRLGFSVAAHLEPEILIVDEVLAVGDSEFQKKCMGKMGDVSKNEGRTILFVSHNLSAVKKICQTGICIKEGRVEFSGTAEEVVEKYSNDQVNVQITEETLVSTCGRIQLRTPYFSDEKGHISSIYAYGDEIVLNFPLSFNKEVSRVNVGFAVLNNFDQRIFTSHSIDDEHLKRDKALVGDIMFSTSFNLNSLAPGSYKVIYGVRDENDNTVIYSEENVYFEIHQQKAKNGSGGILWHTSLWRVT